VHTTLYSQEHSQQHSSTAQTQNDCSPLAVQKMRRILTRSANPYRPDNPTRLGKENREIGVKEIICLIGNSNDASTATLQRSMITLRTHGPLTGEEYRIKDYEPYTTFLTWPRSMYACILSLEDANGARPTADQAIYELRARASAIGLTRPPDNTKLKARYNEFYATNTHRNAPIPSPTKQLFGSHRHYTPERFDADVLFDLVVIVRHRNTDSETRRMGES
jgi:hypothetical protein